MLCCLVPHRPNPLRLILWCLCYLPFPLSLTLVQFYLFPLPDIQNFCDQKLFKRNAVLPPMRAEFYLVPFFLRKLIVRIVAIVYTKVFCKILHSPIWCIHSNPIGSCQSEIFTSIVYHSYHLGCNGFPHKTFPWIRYPFSVNLNQFLVYPQPGVPWVICDTPLILIP